MGLTSGVSVREAFHQIASALKKNGYENPFLNAEHLLSSVLSCRRIDLYLDPHRFLNRHEATSLDKALERRLSHTPLQYITGSTQFLSLDFFVNEHVFIPRPETEVVVEIVIRRLQTMVTGDEPCILVDLGTGCGNIAVTLAEAFPNARVYATDISEEALSVARKNAERNSLSNNISFLQGDLFEPLIRLGLMEKVQALVCNPPYIIESDIQNLPPEVRNHEPRLALSGGQDGLDIIRRVVREAPPFMKQGGFLVLEVGHGQAETVRRLLDGMNTYEEIRINTDLSGIERVVIAVKKG